MIPPTPTALAEAAANLYDRAAAGTTWALLDTYLDRRVPARRRAKRPRPRVDAA